LNRAFIYKSTENLLKAIKPLQERLVLFVKTIAFGFRELLCKLLTLRVKAADMDDIDDDDDDE